jgi:hypothetical protein
LPARVIGKTPRASESHMNAYHIRQGATSSHHRRASHTGEHVAPCIFSVLDEFAHRFPDRSPRQELQAVSHVREGARRAISSACRSRAYSSLPRMSPLAPITYPTWLYTLHLFDGLNRLSSLLSLFAASPASHSGWVSVSPR